MEDWIKDLLWIGVAVVLVIVNGFFVAAEFALVKVRGSRLDELAREGKAFAKTARWLFRRMDKSLSACQLGITMASLALGWVGEPAIASLIEPLFVKMQIGGAAVHTISFIIAFTLITAAHLVIGEQVPKIYALRRSEAMSLWCALPLKWFYLLSYPFQLALSKSTAVLLRRLGVVGGGHDEAHSEEELRALLSLSHVRGELTRSEHQMLEAVFEFDDRVCREIMVPRPDVEFLDIDDSRDDVLRQAKATQHTRYPVCEKSLDHVLGFVHMKDVLIDLADTGEEEKVPFDLRTFLRPPINVPETLPIGRLMRRFQSGRNHLAFVIDERGTMTGIATMENVIEQIVGPVQDEFDDETPAIVPDGPGRYLILGSTRLETINRVVDLNLNSEASDTFAGLVMERLDRIPRPGDRVEFDNFAVEVTDVEKSRAARIRLIIESPEESSEPGEP